MNANGKYATFIKGKRIQMCDILQKPKLDYVLHRGLNMMKKYSNSSFSCPSHTVGYVYPYELFSCSVLWILSQYLFYRIFTILPVCILKTA